MKKLTLTLLIFGIIVSLEIIPLAHGDVSSAIAYLKGQSPSVWTSMALIAAGENPNLDFLKNFSGSKAIDYAAPILTLTASGKNPRTFSNEDLIFKLKSFHAQNQIGDNNLLNDDIFGILALASAGEPIEDQAIQDAKNFILNHQNSDGSWPFAVASAGDTNTTAMAIIALYEVGLSKSDDAISRALNYLKNAQNSDGGFPYDPQSSWSTSSDASSDAWVISALNKIGESPSSWEKNGQNPIDHLNSLATEAGYYEFQKGTGEDSFTSVTTAYAVVALLGKSYPIGEIEAPTYPQVSYRIAGSSKDLCSGRAEAPSALELVKIISKECGFGYSIKETSFGPYLESIGEDEATGSMGWLYAVNFTTPSIGAADYNLQENDHVLWYYSDFNWKLTRLSLNNSEIPSGSSVEAEVQYLEGSWYPLEGAALHYGLNTVQTGPSGKATFNPSDGAYQVFATKEGYVRTETEKVIVGPKTETPIGLNANVISSDGTGSGSNPVGEAVGFSILLPNGASNLDFGDIKPGNTKSQNLTLQNQGEKNLYLESNVVGDDVFVKYLNLDSRNWENFNFNLRVGQSKNAEVELSIPASYSVSGQKSGQLIFWAIPQNE